MILTQQKLPSSILVVNNTANKSMLLRTETPLVLCVGLSQVPVPESQLVLLHLTLLNPKAVKLIQKRYPCTGNLNSGSPGTVNTHFYIVKMFQGLDVMRVVSPANKSMVLRTETPLVLFPGLSQLPVAERQMVLLLFVRGWM